MENLAAMVKKYNQYINDNIKWKKYNPLKKIINENILVGEDISKITDMLMHRIKKGNKINDYQSLINQLNSFFLGKKIYFVEPDDIIDTYPTASRYKSISDDYGFLGGFINNHSEIFIILDGKSLLVNMYEYTGPTIQKLKIMVNHELVHREQYKKIGNKINTILLNKLQHKTHTMDPLKQYFKEPREIMAYAKTIVDELEKHFSKEDILECLRSGYAVSPTQSLYKKIVDNKTYKKLLKYIYQYVNITEESK